jgi:hypothetical protein
MIPEKPLAILSFLSISPPGTTKGAGGVLGVFENLGC